MGTGLFSTVGRGANFRSRKSLVTIRRVEAKQMWSLAGHIAEGGTMAEWARLNELSTARASYLWRMICGVVGWQAQ